MKRTFFTEQQEKGAKDFDPQRDKFAPKIVVYRFVCVFFFALLLIDGVIVLLTLAYSPEFMERDDFRAALGAIPIATGIFGIFHFDFLAEKLSSFLEIVKVLLDDRFTHTGY